MTAVVDTDFLVAYIRQADENHSRAKKIYQELDSGIYGTTRLILLNSTLAEFTTVLTIRVNFDTAKKAATHYAQIHQLMAVTPEMTLEALDLLQTQASKENSLFDCYIMVATRQLQADCILSFDKGYQQNGLILYSDIQKRQDNHRKK